MCNILYEATENSPTDASFGRLLGPLLCPACAQGFSPVTSPICPRCGEPFATTAGNDHLCGRCIGQPRQFTRARSVGLYDQSLLGLIHCLKYRGQVALALPLGRLLFEAWLEHWNPDDMDLILPVPLHPRRLRARGFNQAYLLIRQWPQWVAQIHGRSDKGLVSRNVLLRHRPTPPQTQLGQKHRLENVHNAFSVTPKISVHGLRILVVDDVYTTGATANACAEALLKAGAHQVDVLTLARTRN